MDVGEILTLLETRGHSQYGQEAVTQLQHALQAAALAEAEGADAPLIAAALLHDVGHLLHELPEDAPDSGVDDHHETYAANRLRGIFPLPVTEPIRLHVAAKRHLCTVEPAYKKLLSQPSLVSLALQGGPMSREEVAEMEAHFCYQDAVRLRRWDDAAKDRRRVSPPLSHFAPYVYTAARGPAWRHP